ncbi:MAG: rod shape-determining protein MreC [Thermodesulfobacteriota bacterium]|nr:rod shape-determining protein MreC [Thermodesulfobacteriota bacterium]
MASPKKHYTVIVVVVLVVISLTIFSLNFKSPARMSFFRKIVLEAVVPLEGAVDSAFSSVTGVWKRYVLLVGLERKNRDLETKIVSLTRDASNYREMSLDCARLRKLMNIKNDFKFPTVAARVVGKNRSSVFKTVLINKGTADGIKTGFPVMGTGGVAGRIMETSRNASKVLLLVDYNSNIDALVQRNRCQGVLRGCGSSGCELRYIQRSEDVKTGDIVVSSGLAGVFPRGLLIGKITVVDKGESRLFQKIMVHPATDITKLEEVLVILGGKEDNG